MNQLFAFNNAQDVQMDKTEGHYDAEVQMWVGDNKVNASASPDGLTVKNPTATITFPFIPDADADVDWE